jgi:F-type H+-transporting ATPase subunit b
MTMQASDIIGIAQASLMGNGGTASGGGVTVDFDLSFLIQFAAFLLLFIIIKPLLLDPFLKVVEEREKRTDGAREEARKMDDRAAEIIKSYESELEKVRKVAAEERERLRSEGLKLETKILSETREETDRILDEGKAKIAIETQAIRQELNLTTQVLAAEIASRVLGRELR